MRYEYPRPGQCVAVVYVRDTYRNARGRGFQMHYNRQQCSRKVKAGDFCWQHQETK